MITETTATQKTIRSVYNMRTTNKAFKTQIQEHIIDSLGTDETTVLSEQLENVVSEFNSYYSPYEQRHTPNLQDAFGEFLRGLPSCLNQEYTYHGIHTTLKSWWENVGEVYKEQDSEKEAHLYYALLYREFQTLCKQNGVGGIR